MILSRTEAAVVGAFVGTLVAGIGHALFLMTLAGSLGGLRLSCVIGALAGAAVGAISAGRRVKDVCIVAGLVALFLGPGLTFALIFTAFSLVRGGS